MQTLGRLFKFRGTAIVRHKQLARRMSQPRTFTRLDDAVVGELLSGIGLLAERGLTKQRRPPVAGSNDPSRNSDHNSRSALNWAT